MEIKLCTLLLILLSVVAGAAGLPDGVNPGDRLLQLGYLDVTKAPYGADPTGIMDATHAVQRAVNDARDFQLVCFFPAGTYLISETISCEMGARKLAAARKGGIRYDIDRERPCILVGSKNGKHPTIRLAPGAKGFDDPTRPRVAIHIWAQTRNNAPGKREPVWGKEQANISFNQMFRGIDIDIRGHAGAIGIQHSGSQGSSLEDVTIHAEGAFAGMENCPGQGGGTYNVTVLGGRYGLHASTQVRYPMLAGCVFQGQTLASIAYSGGIPMLCVGCRFAPQHGPAFDLAEGEARAGLNVIDSVIAATGEIVKTPSANSLYLENVFVSGATGISHGGPKLGGTQAWTHIKRYASCPPKAALMINGTQASGDLIELEPAAAAPDYEALHDRHLWRDQPNFEDADAVNAKTLGAKGDGVADDSAALQAAIDSHEKIFLPRGTYRVTRPLVLGAKTCLFGVARIDTTILASDGFGEQGRPLVTTVDNADAATRLADLSLAQYASDPNVNLLTWRAGRQSSVHNVYFELKEGLGEARKVRDHATTLITGNGGGRWWAVNAIEGRFAPTTTAPGYRRLLVEGTHEPLAWYALNIERVVANPQSEIRNASGVRIYYFKAEAGSSGNRSRNTPLQVRDSRGVAVYCFSGNIELEDGRAVVELANSADVTLTTLKPFRGGNYYTLRDKSDGKTLTVPSNTAVALYRTLN